MNTAHLVTDHFLSLLDLQKQLRYRGYDSLELDYLAKLRAEVDREVAKVVAADKAKREEGVKS